MRPATGPTVAPKSFDPLIHLDTNHTIKGYFPNDYFCLASKVDGGARHIEKNDF